MRSTQSAFTLIELLTVIAIIGILAAVIITSLNDARQQGIVAKIQTEMDSVAKRASIEEQKVLTYDIVCGSNGTPTSTRIFELFESINRFASSTVTCNSSAASYAVSVPINTVHWCVDSGGVKKEILNALNPGDLVCP